MRLGLITDSHVAAMDAAEPFVANWRGAARAVADLDADLTVHLGDITVDGAADRDQLEFARDLAGHWPGQIRFIPGNHDIGDNPPGPGIATKEPLDLGRLGDFQRIFGPDRWSIDGDGWTVIALNAQLFGTGTVAEQGQDDWLARTVSAAHGDIALLLHKPLFQNGPDDEAPHIRYLPAGPRRRLLDLLRQTGRWRVTVSGHTHQHLDRTVEGVRHVWMPSCAFYLPDGLQERVGEKVVGIGMLDLTPGECRFDLILPQDVIRHSILDHAIYPEVAAARAKLGL